MRCWILSGEHFGEIIVQNERNVLSKEYYDWPDLVTSDGQQQNHYINIAGNAKKISYRVSLGYQKEDGVLGDSYERWNLKAAVDNKINDHFLSELW